MRLINTFLKKKLRNAIGNNREREERSNNRAKVDAVPRLFTIVSAPCTDDFDFVFVQFTSYIKWSLYSNCDAKLHCILTDNSERGTRRYRLDTNTNRRN